MARPTEASGRAREDTVIFVVLLFALGFLMFMMSVPIWFGGVVRALTG